MVNSGALWRRLPTGAPGLLGGGLEAVLRTLRIPPEPEMTQNGLLLHVPIYVLSLIDLVPLPGSP
jgi:hypothetical protein